MTTPTSRREFLSLAGTASAVLLGLSPEAFERALTATRMAQQGQSVTLETLTPAQAADLEAIAAQIIPTDDLPGAREARVIVFIDRVRGELAASVGFGPADDAGGIDDILVGIEDLNSRVVARAGSPARFAALSSVEQHALLEEIQETPFFRQMRLLTITGMFAHPNWGGNYEGAGWKVLGFEPRFFWQPPFGAYDAEVQR
ncbi:MAG TPA: gluconate 2-dehydrogenase subunit 3 family protein [Gemmatimonadales bacterium]|jgi:gluconate 2-dehydrogenase gamma chain